MGELLTGYLWSNWILFEQTVEKYDISTVAYNSKSNFKSQQCFLLFLLTTIKDQDMGVFKNWEIQFCAFP